MKRYLLRNTKKYDINLGDLRYKIPAGQVRDLFGKNARLSEKDIENSVIRGSIKSKLKTGALVEVIKFVDLLPPNKVDVSKLPIMFPRQKKSSIILDVSKLDEQLNNMVLNEEDDLLKELQEEDMFAGEAGAPLVAQQEKEDV